MELQSTFDASSRSIDISSDYEAADIFTAECWTSPLSTSTPAYDVFGPVVTVSSENKEEVLLHDDAGNSSIDSSGSYYVPYGLGAKYIPSVSINLHNWTDDEVIATSPSDSSNDEGQSLLVDLPAPSYPASEGASFEVPMFPLLMSETIEAAKERLEWRSFRRISSQGPTGFSPSSSCAAAARRIFTAKPPVTACSEVVPVGTSSSHLTPAVSSTHLSASSSFSFADCILQFGKERKEWNSFADATFPQGTGFSPTSSCSAAARRLFPQREEQSDPLSPSNSSMEMCPSSSYARLREFIEERPDSEARRTMLSARLTRRTPTSSTSSAAPRSFPKPSEVYAEGSKTDKKGDKENTRPTVRSSRRRL
ncbi:hypothetical protein C8Q75DRAFT_771204 [Abortiporus biennis]|nr:hypothetical protein C8Q75DRAFT_771204 [Abortiporus biennis]